MVHVVQPAHLLDKFEFFTSISHLVQLFHASWPNHRDDNVDEVDDDKITLQEVSCLAQKGTTTSVRCLPEASCITTEVVLTPVLGVSSENLEAVFGPQIVVQDPHNHHGCIVSDSGRAEKTPSLWPHCGRDP